MRGQIVKPFEYTISVEKCHISAVHLSFTIWTFTLVLVQSLQLPLGGGGAQHLLIWLETATGRAMRWKMRQLGCDREAVGQGTVGVSFGGRRGGC